MSRIDPAPVIAGIAMLAVWELFARFGGLPAFVLPSPSAIAAAFVDRAGILLPAAGVTLGLALTALTVATLLGVAIALAFSRLPWLERGLGPYALVLQATPIVAIAPLVIIWVGVENPRRAIVLLSVIAAFFPVLTNAIAGLKAVDPGLDRLFRLHRASGWRRFTLLELPTAAPYLLAGLKTAAGLALVGTIVAEFVAGTGATGGLAWRIVEAGNRLETATMFAALGLLAAMGLALHAAIGWAEARARGG